MSTVKQVALLAAGSQPWNNDVCAVSGNRFAYCATLAIYIYQCDEQYSEFQLHSILSEHSKTITAIAWNARDVDLIVSAGADHQVIVWNVARQTVVARLEKIKEIPCSVGWCLHEKETVSFIYGRGPFFLWNYGSDKGGGISHHKEAQSFSSPVCQFRWHHKKLGKLVIGHKDGSISLFCPGVKPHKHILRPEAVEDSDLEEDPVIGLEWDPLSTDYLLAVNSDCGIRLVDTSSWSVLMTFKLPSVAARVQTLAWVDSAPGMFLTGDANVGILRLWNVSKSTPIENIKLKKTGFHSLCVYCSSPRLCAKDNSAKTSSGSPASPPAGSTNSSFALPPAHAVCTFVDGGVGLYDLGKRKWDFLRDQGHIETIFDCKFSPDNPDRLATASFDGTIKVWDVHTLTPITSSPGNEGVIYNISWAPADLNCIAASTSRNGAFIWDVEKGTVIKRFQEHGRYPVYTVAWCQRDAKRIATGGGDGSCVVRQVDGKLIMKYRHPAPVFGCDWSPHNKDMLATGCEDKCVRVYYLATTADQPLKIFSGHVAKVFHVKWSPLREGILCSGSDDCSIRIWDYTQDSCISVLGGHTAPVRGLLWNTEIPYMLISGSWDYSICIWDVRDGACIDTILDHGADVYGLTCHPSRPFVLASCSRDSTLRLWSLLPHVQPLQATILARRPWSEVLGTVEYSISPGTSPLLTGKASRDLKQSIDLLQGDIHAKTLRLFSEFFMHPGDTQNLWELISVIQGVDDTMLASTYKKGIMHVKHLVKHGGSVAQELQLFKMTKSSAGVGSGTREEKLHEAAQIYIRIGNIQRYCEVMVELGKWEKALSVAPGVSLDYWKSLTERYARYLTLEDSDEVVPYHITTGQAEELVNFFTNRGQLQDAVLIAQVACEKILPTFEKKKRRSDNHMNGSGENETKHFSSLLHSVCDSLADWHFRNGAPIRAACCHLAVGDCNSAMSKLIRGNVLELAVSMGTVLKNVPQLTQVATEYLARRCEKIGKWQLALDLLKTIPDNELSLMKLCARCVDSTAEINSLHQKAGLPSMEECESKAKVLQEEKKTLDSVKYYLLSPTPEVGLQIGLTYIKEALQKPSWQLNDVFPMLEILGCIRINKLQQTKYAKLCQELLILSAYVGALVALRRQYTPIIIPLLRHAKSLLEQSQSDLPLSTFTIQQELEACRAHQTVKKTSSDDSAPSSDNQSLYATLLKRCGKETHPVGVGEDRVTGCHLPSHSDVHMSFIDNQRIQGPAYFLEDGKSAISINHALMWAKVNPFSPLGISQLNPF